MGREVVTVGEDGVTEIALGGDSGEVRRNFVLGVLYRSNARAHASRIAHSDPEGVVEYQGVGSSGSGMFGATGV